MYTCIQHVVSNIIKVIKKTDLANRLSACVPASQLHPQKHGGMVIPAEDDFFLFSNGLTITKTKCVYFLLFIFFW